MRTNDAERHLLRSKMARFSDRSNLPSDLNVTIPRTTTPTTAADGKKELASPLVCFDRFTSTREAPRADELRGEQSPKNRKLSIIAESVYPGHNDCNSMVDIGSDHLQSIGRPSHADFQSPKGPHLSLFSGHKHYQYRKLSSLNKLDSDQPASLLDLPKSGLQAVDPHKSPAASVTGNSLLFEQADKPGPLPPPATLGESDGPFKTPLLTRIVSDFHQLDGAQDKPDSRDGHPMEDSTVLKHDLNRSRPGERPNSSPRLDLLLLGYSGHHVALPAHGLHLSTGQPVSPQDRPEDRPLQLAAESRQASDEEAFGFLSVPKSHPDHLFQFQPVSPERPAPRSQHDASPSVSSLSENSASGLFAGLPAATALKLIRQLEEEKAYIETKLKRVDRRIRLLKTTLSPRLAPEAKPSARTPQTSLGASPEAQARPASSKHRAFVLRTSTHTRDPSARLEPAKPRSLFAKKQPVRAAPEDTSDSPDRLDFTRLNHYILQLACAKPAPDPRPPKLSQPPQPAPADRRSFYSQVRDSSRRPSLLSKRDSMVSTYEKMATRGTYSRSKTDVFG